jgi:hypothetical protein
MFENLKLFDKKTSDTTTSGFNVDEITAWLNNVERIEEFKYYYFAPGARRPTESKNQKNQPVAEIVSFLIDNFIESPDSFVEIQKKTFKSGKHEVIFRAINMAGTKREVTKLAVLNYRKTTN